MTKDAYTNEDFLAALVEAQSTARAPGPANFTEWRAEQQFNKSQRSSVTPGFGLMGSQRADTRSRPQGAMFNGNVGAGDVGNGSKYNDIRPNQPPNWIEDVNTGGRWNSPMEPVWPFGPPIVTMPQEWDFNVGYNLNYVPQRLNLMGMLRGMRQSWGVLSTIISTRQDQLLRVPWTIQLRNKPKGSSKTVDAVRQFFRKPDGKLSYSIWSRKYLDDLLVIDAPTLYMDRDLGGRLRQAQVLDGGTIFPLIDDAGRRPDTDYSVGPNGLIYERRQPAFQQIIQGMPMIDLSEDEIIYGMMHPRPEMPMFGYSPVEQIFTEATEAIRKTFYQGEFWRAGSMPELIITVPEAWSPRQIATFQAHFDAVLSGQLTLKSKVRFVPGGMKPFDIKNASGESLWSQRDELLVRLACYALSVSPTPFVKQTNRATASQAQESANEEGLYPLMAYWKEDVMDVLLQEKMGYEDIEFVYLPRPESDQKKQSEIHQVRLQGGIITINEARGELGLEPVEDGDHHLISTGASIVRLDQVIAGDALMPGAPAPTSDPRPAAPSGRSVSPVRGPARPREASPVPAATPVAKLLHSDVADAADRAERDPSKAKKKAGNYRKGHVTWQGLKIAIENAKGSKRQRGENFVKMPAAYGYIKGTVGADDMHVDCYLGKHPAAPKVWVIDQDRVGKGGKIKGFDEHKVMLGYESLAKAQKDYLNAHWDGFGSLRLAAAVEISYEELKGWLKEGDTQLPLADQEFGEVVYRRSVDATAKADTIAQSTGLLAYDQGSAKGKRRRKNKRKLHQGPKWLTLVA